MHAEVHRPLAGSVVRVAWLCPHAASQLTPLLRNLSHEIPSKVLDVRQGEGWQRPARTCTHLLPTPKLRARDYDCLPLAGCQHTPASNTPNSGQEVTTACPLQAAAHTCFQHSKLRARGYGCLPLQAASKELELRQGKLVEARRVVEEAMQQTEALLGRQVGGLAALLAGRLCVLPSMWVGRKEVLRLDQGNHRHTAGSPPPQNDLIACFDKHGGKGAATSILSSSDAHLSTLGEFESGLSLCAYRHHFFPSIATTDSRSSSSVQKQHLSAATCILSQCARAARPMEPHPSGIPSMYADRIAAVRDVIGPPENTADDGIQLFELLGEGTVSRGVVLAWVPAFRAALHAWPYGASAQPRSDAPISLYLERTACWRPPHCSPPLRSLGSASVGSGAG